MSSLTTKLVQISKQDVDSGCYETPEMMQAGVAYIRAFNAFLKKAGATDIRCTKNHFERTVKFTSPDGQRWAIYSGDFRGWCGGQADVPAWVGPYFREVRDDNDHTGGVNQCHPLRELEGKLNSIVFKLTSV